MPSSLRAALIDQAVRHYKFDMEPVPTDGIHEMPKAETRAFRRELRLLLKATVDIRLAERNQEFTNDLRRIPWADSQERAFRAGNRLMEIAGWAEAESGEEAASMWESAARIAELLGEDYNGWPYTESYDDIAGSFFTAVRAGFDQQIFSELLAALEGS